MIQMKEYDNLDKKFSKMMQEASQFYWRQQYSLLVVVIVSNVWFQTDGKIKYRVL